MAVRRLFSTFASSDCGHRTVHGHSGEVVVGKKTLGIELHRLRVALARFLQMPLTKFEETQGLLRRNIIRIFLQHVIQKGACVCGSLVVGQEVGSQRVGLRRSSAPAP